MRIFTASHFELFRCSARGACFCTVRTVHLSRWVSELTVICTMYPNARGQFSVSKKPNAVHNPNPECARANGDFNYVDNDDKDLGIHRKYKYMCASEHRTICFRSGTRQSNRLLYAVRKFVFRYAKTELRLVLRFISFHVNTYEARSYTAWYISSQRYRDALTVFDSMLLCVHVHAYTFTIWRRTKMLIFPYYHKRRNERNATVWLARSR